MQTTSNSDPVTQVIKACHRGEEVANRIYHLIAEQHQRRLILEDDAVELDEQQVGEFVARFSAEVEPEYWHSKRRKE